MSSVDLLLLHVEEERKKEREVNSSQLVCAYFDAALLFNSDSNDYESNNKMYINDYDKEMEEL